MITHCGLSVNVVCTTRGKYTYFAAKESKVAESLGILDDILKLEFLHDVLIQLGLQNIAQWQIQQQ